MPFTAAYDSGYDAGYEIAPAAVLSVSPITGDAVVGNVILSPIIAAAMAGSATLSAGLITRPILAIASISGNAVVGVVVAAPVQIGAALAGDAVLSAEITVSTFPLQVAPIVGNGSLQAVILAGAVLAPVALSGQGSIASTLISPIILVVTVGGNAGVLAVLVGAATDIALRAVYAPSIALSAVYAPSVHRTARYAPGARLPVR